MRLADRALVSPEPPPLEQRDNSVHSGKARDGELVVPSEQGNLMVVAILRHAVVAMPPVRVHNAAWQDRVRDKRLQPVGRRIGNPALS